MIGSGRIRARIGLPVTLFLALLGPIACQDGGLVGTGSGPTGEKILIRAVPVKLVPDFPASALFQSQGIEGVVDTETSTTTEATQTPQSDGTIDTLDFLSFEDSYSTDASLSEDVQSVADATESQTDTDITSRTGTHYLFEKITESEVSLIELITLFNSVWNTVSSICGTTDVGTPCGLTAGMLSTTYTDELIEELVSNRLAASTVAALSTTELVRLVSAISIKYNARKGETISFGETTFTRLSTENDTMRVKTSLSSAFSGNPVTVTWSEDESWVEIIHVDHNGFFSKNVYLRFEEHTDHTVLTQSRVSNNANIDYEASITVIGMRDDTTKILWSAHSSGISGEFGYASETMKGQADKHGGFTRRSVYVNFGASTVRMKDEERSLNDKGGTIASRRCRGEDRSRCFDIVNPITMETVDDSPYYIDFDQADVQFLPVQRSTKWQIQNLPVEIDRFAVFAAGTIDPQNEIPLCRGYRIGLDSANFYCTTDESGIDTDTVLIYQIVPTGSGQQFILAPDARLIRQISRD